MASTKIEIDSFIYPMPVVLVGAMVEEKPTFLAIGWVMRTKGNPPTVAFTIAKARYTMLGIEEHGEFSVNVPSADLVEKTDLCGMVSGHKRDKSALFSTFKGELEYAPMIAECPYALECRVTETKDGDGSWIVFGEVVGAYSDEKYLTGGKADPMKSDPFVLVMPGGGYHRIGERIADAWGCGNTLLDQAPEK